MRIKRVFIGDYKNLKHFSLDFETESFIDVFVGKNGSGKSNFLEALVEIFDHIYGFNKTEPGPGFDYEIVYEIEGVETELIWREGQIEINGRSRKMLGKTPVPDNIIVYYSGQNETVANQIDRYQGSYRARVKGSSIADSPRFIGVGPNYKQLLLALLLMQPEAYVSRIFLCSKLGIEGAGETATLRLCRPSFAARSRQYDPFDDDEIFWGAKGIVREFLDELLLCIRGEYTIGSLYERDSDEYVISINVERFRDQFADRAGDEVFRSFDALKSLEMLADITIPVQLIGNVVINTSQFSDGQFQSVYVFAISEIFKDRHCLTLLDEPDAFLHPEWQFDFLQQVLKISEEAAQTNHILMSSHSASTIAADVGSRIHLFEVNGLAVQSTDLDKASIIKTLSAGLITFSETEACLNVDHILTNTEKPVLFTEGLSDKIILETAWAKLFPADVPPFDVEQAYSCDFIRVLVKRQAIFDGNPNRKIFMVFDFDDAYKDWAQLGEQIEVNPERCLTRKYKDHECYSMLLPVPAQSSIRGQVINLETGEHYGDRARMPIELLFRDVPGLEGHFEPDPAERDQCIRFVGDKVRFASDIIPGQDPDYFEVFRPIFDFVQARLA